VRRTKEPEACKPCFSSTSFVIAVSIISGWLTFTAARATSRRLQRKRCVWQFMQDVESLLGAKMPRRVSRYCMRQPSERWSARAVKSARLQAGRSLRPARCSRPARTLPCSSPPRRPRSARQQGWWGRWPRILVRGGPEAGRALAPRGTAPAGMGPGTSSCGMCTYCIMLQDMAIALRPKVKGARVTRQLPA